MFEHSDNPVHMEILLGLMTSEDSIDSVDSVDSVDFKVFLPVISNRSFVMSCLLFLSLSLSPSTTHRPTPSTASALHRE